MSTELYADVVVGYVFDSWFELAQKLTEKDQVDDSSSVERYAKALGIRVVILQSGEAIFCVDVPFDPCPEETSFVSLDYFEREDFKKSLVDLKNKLNATGFKVLSEPCIVRIHEYF